MSVTKSIFFMGSSTALRIFSGLLTFTFLARSLGPENFGQFMLWFSIANLLGLISNYGLTPYMLREITVQKERATKLIGDVLTAKLLLAFGMILAVIPACFFIDQDFRVVFILLFLATLFDSLTEFFNTGYRANNRFSSETKMATYAASLQLTFVLCLVYLYPTLLAASIAILASRLFVSFLTWKDQSQYLSGIALGDIKSGVKQLKQAFSYAVDFFLQSLMGQIDSIIINHMIGLSAVGLYQAGMRVFQGLAQSANVLANVFIPRLAKASIHQSQQTQEIQFVQLSFIGVGLVFGLLLVIGASPLTQILYGDAFSALATLFPWLGLLFFTRFYVGSLGVILTSSGMQLFRTYANLVLWVVVAFSAYFLVPKFGLKGWVIALVLGNFLLGLIYMAKVLGHLNMNIKTIVFSVFGMLVFIPIFLIKSS